MMIHHRNTVSALLLAFAAGAALSVNASAQPTNPDQVRDPARPAEQPRREDQPRAARQEYDFRSVGWLSDRKVENTNGEKIATVSDLILDRGSGRIDYAVIKTGATLGMGGKTVAIPYGSFTWDAGNDRFVLASSKDQLKTFPEFTSEHWSAMMENKATEKNELHRRLHDDMSTWKDPYTGAYDTAAKERIEGEVKKIERIRTEGMGEQVVITVATNDGNTRRVALGPSWFINGAYGAPIRGDHVVVETFALPHDPDRLTVGTSVRTGEREIVLRESNGSPAWTSRHIQSGGKSYSLPYGRFLLLSHLKGKAVNCRGQECGKVNDVIIERHSGEVAFLSIDPNEAFLGIRDTKRLVPWSVATVTLDGTVQIDASKEMVLASPETPSDLTKLNIGDHAPMVFNAYQVTVPRFEAPRSVPLNEAQHRGAAWTAGGPIITSIDRSSKRVVNGKIVEVTEVTLADGMESARAVKVKVDGQDSLVLVGPAWYVDKQKSPYTVGEMFNANVVRTNINGKTYWLARDVDYRGDHFILIDTSDAPIWEKK